MRAAFMATIILVATTGCVSALPFTEDDPFDRFHDADVRFRGVLDPSGAAEVEGVYRFPVPLDTTAMDYRAYYEYETWVDDEWWRGNERQVSMSESSPPTGGGHGGLQNVTPGGWSFRLSSDAPVEFVVGVYFERSE